MDLREYVDTETSAFAERLIAAAEASTEQVRRAADAAREVHAAEADDLRQQLGALRSEADRHRTEAERHRDESARLRVQLDTQLAHASELNARLEALQAAQRETANARLAALAAHAETETTLREARDELEAARAEIGRLSEALETSGSRAAAALEAESSRNAMAKQAQEGIVRELQAHHDRTVGALQTQHDGIVRELQAQLDAARMHGQRDTEQAGVLERRLADAESALARLRDQVTEANAMTDAVHEGLAVMRTRSERVRTRLRDSVKALHAVGAGTTATEVFSALVRLLSAEFPRVAIFRVKGNHLEGELSAGLDAAIDVTKLVIPVGLDSVVSRAAAGLALEQATAEQIADSRSPFGATPASALAAPLMFQGETLAVVYADSDDAPNDAHAAFAAVLVAHANLLLSRLTQELKTAKVLREYAQMLLREAEQMFLADAEEGRAEADRLRRLHDTIEFGRQLFAQRAELEGGLAAGLLEDEITALIRAEPVTPFGRGLAAALADTREQRTAS